MKTMTFSVLAALATIVPYSDTVRAQTEDLVTVTAPSLAAWSDKVFNDLNRQIRYPEPLGNTPESSGVVAVKFNCSDTGAPAGIELHKSSGHRDLDRETLRAVNKIATLHPLPVGLKHDQVYIVRVLYARSDSEAARQLTKMREEAAENNAWYNKDTKIARALELVPVGGELNSSPQQGFGCSRYRRVN